MNLQKNLISFYKKSKKLEIAREELKELKKSSVKLNKNKEFTINEIQAAIDYQLKLRELNDTIVKLPRAMSELQRQIIALLKSIGLPVKRTISINDEKYGNLTFWYEGIYLYFDDSVD